jgi:hypothetical protein
MACPRTIRALGMLGCLFLASPLRAQTVNPNVVEFLPPADASSISRYDVAFYQATALDPFLVVSLGKPAPQADGLIRADITTSIGVWPQPNTATVARIVAVTSASNLSPASNQFTYTCDFSLSSAAATIGASGGTGTFNVTTSTWCGWTAKSSVSWITVTSGASGKGSGSIGYSVAANTASTSRTGTITVGTAVLTITQGAASSSSPTNPPTTTQPTNPPTTSDPANTPPTVRILRPSDGAVLSGASIRIDAKASDSDGTIASVVFYANEIQVGKTGPGNTAPTVRWYRPIAGSYMIKALATDNDGATAWSAPVSVTVR